MAGVTPRRGRPRSAESRAAVLRAAFELLGERGYGGVTVEGVAERAGVGKATVYRWWATRAELAVEAFFEATRDELALAVTDDPAADFRSQVRRLGAVLRGPAGPALVGMAAGGLGDPVLRRALDERWLAPRRAWGRERMARAVAAGQCRPDLDVAAAITALYAPLYAQPMSGGAPLTAAEVDAHLAVVLPGIFLAWDAARPGT